MYRGYNIHNLKDPLLLELLPSLLGFQGIPSVHIPLDSVLDSQLWYSAVRCRGLKTSSFQVRVVANTDYFAQASWPRLGEMSRSSPRVCYASRRSGDPTLVLSERTSRLGGEGLT
ncbi:hypothetical protein DEO72_LG4g2078 [Vigna unguiculata]|uniref:Uncharacterized protein n=1 Tax=Vigna unguiculata TaxID=3917 RepID=A0A4D6LT15_VIGUN|nr:hypothetical protein DEO72_LG4g2078 [Vigna unguiculata]